MLSTGLIGSIISAYLYGSIKVKFPVLIRNVLRINANQFTVLGSSHYLWVGGGANKGGINNFSASELRGGANFSASL